MTLRSKPYPDDKTVLETFLWYFSTIKDSSTQDLDKNKRYAIELGRMIQDLDMRYICSLDNHDGKKFDSTAEYELVGRGLLDPLYRLKNSNDTCFYQLGLLQNVIENGYLDRLKENKVASDHLKTLAPFVILLLNKHRQLISDQAKVDIQFPDDGFIRELSTDDNVRLLVDSAKRELFNAIEPLSHNLIKHLRVVCSPDPDAFYKVAPKDALIQILNGYLSYRNAIESEYYTFFGSCFGGFSKAEKNEAVNNLITAIESNDHTVLTEQNFGALNNGNLKKSIADWETRSGQTLDAFIGRIVPSAVV